VKAIDKISLTLADGQRVEYDIGELGRRSTGPAKSPSQSSESTKPALCWGPTTLEGLRLAVDPANGKLIPATTAWA